MTKVREIHSMTKRELIEALANFDDDTPVLLSYDYGDHWHTIVANEIHSVEEQTLIWSDYHETFRVAENDEDEESPKNAIVIS